MIYLSFITWQDITYVVGQLSKQNADLRIGYLKVTKRVVQYLKDIIHLRLTYESHSKSKKEEKPKTLARQSIFGLIRYINSNYIGDCKNKLLVMRYYIFIDKAIMSWFSKKQRTVLNSTIKAKYIALENVA